ncbi:MAG: LysM peptidoglycan-binding domain-containing protein [Saprospirales bacterium]|nr:LysM peptidoglycan-binding domain-containing protein [Saprospirales bacterium]
MKTISTYKVVKGDTLFGISKKFGMTVADLKALNGLKGNALSIGQVLKVQVEQSPSTPPAPPPKTTGSTSAVTTYKVVKGDTLYSIGRKFGVSADSIKQTNKLKTSTLKIGQVLKIPGSAPVQPLPDPVVVPPPIVTPPVVSPPGAGDYLAARGQFGLIVRPDAGFQRFEIQRAPAGWRNCCGPHARQCDVFALYEISRGHCLWRAIHPASPSGKIASVGLNRHQAAALEYVSSHEGKYDAINSYDGGIFSYGFIQFVGAAGHGGSLNRVLASMKSNTPARFAQVFQQVGIDSAGGISSVLDENGYKRTGDDAWLYIQKTVPLYGAFIQAGFDADLVLEQLRAANDLYVQPALNFKLNLNINGIQISIPRLRDILHSEALLTALIAIAINRGAGAMSRITADAVAAVAAPARLHTVEALRLIDERQVCQTIADTATDGRTRDRAQGVLNAGLSFAKV